MRVLYAKNVSLGLSTGTSDATVDLNVVARVTLPYYVGGVVADTAEEYQAARSYISSLQKTILQNGYTTAEYQTALATIPWLFRIPVHTRTWEFDNQGSLGAQEALESIVNNVQVYLPETNIIKTATISRNNVIFHPQLYNLGFATGYSIDNGLTWLNPNGIFMGGIGGYESRVIFPIFNPDLTQAFTVLLANSYNRSNDPYTHSVYFNATGGTANVSNDLKSALQTFFDLAPVPTPGGGDADPYDNLPTPGDDPLPGGGAVGIPGFPGLTATSAGVIGLFCPSAAQMQLLADFMWTDFGGTGTTVEEILQEVVEALKRTISNPLDYIVGLNIIPSQGLSIGSSKSVRFGFVDSGVTMPLLANQYFTVDCGSLAFDTVCGDTFLDYAPYAKFSIYLPYIGFKDVDPNDFVGHSIGVVYHGDCVTGGITAYITKDGSVMYQYSGCCALNVPLSADSWGETISGAISVATGIVAAAATGGAAGVGLAAAKGAASVAANPSLLSPQVNHSGAVSGGAGCMGVQYPFVIREAVNFHSTAGFNKESGYPAYYYKTLSEVSGFTTVLDPHINNIPQATQGEMTEIISLLESGVIL